MPKSKKIILQGVRFSEIEKILLRNLDSKWTYLHRNIDGDLELHNTEEYKDEPLVKHYDYFNFYNHLFPELHSNSSVLIADVLKEH